MPVEHVVRSPGYFRNMQEYPLARLGEKPAAETALVQARLKEALMA